MTTAAVGPVAFLRGPFSGAVVPDPGLWGFGGLHGGLILGLLTATMLEHAPGLSLHSATARIHRPVTDAVHLDSVLVRAGRRSSATAASLTSARGSHAEATAVFGPPASTGFAPVGPGRPDAPPPDRCPVFFVPPEFVPVSVHVEIRPVGPHRPFEGGATPELTAWVRLIGDDNPPTQDVLAFLMDSLAPSYGAVLSAPAMVPTVEVTFRPSQARPTLPWVLLHARTHLATPDGWIDEHLDAWALDGTHLATAHQLRILSS